MGPSVLCHDALTVCLCEHLSGHHATLGDTSQPCVTVCPTVCMCVCFAGDCAARHCWVFPLAGDGVFHAVAAAQWLQQRNIKPAGGNLWGGSGTGEKKGGGEHMNMNRLDRLKFLLLPCSLHFV